MISLIYFIVIFISLKYFIDVFKFVDSTNLNDLFISWIYFNDLFI